MDRRSFIKNTLALASGAAMTSCVSGNGNKNTDSVTAIGEMTTRTDPLTGVSVSLLGYGMMRLPLKDDMDSNGGRENAPIDQEKVNALVDKAIEAHVTYFDTSPTYCSGNSETATGIALARHPRDKWTIATKLSNFREEAQTREASIAMYENSFKALQVDYIDYYLLHSVGRSMENFNSRFIDNGMLDFLVGERLKGRIRHLGFSFHGNKEVFDTLLAMHGKYHWDFVQIQMNYVDWECATAKNPRNVNSSYLYDRLTELGIPVVIMEPLQGGRLGNVPDHIAQDMQQREPSRSIASWAFRFCGTYPNILTTLSGMTYMEHLEDNLQSFCPLKPLTDEESTFLGQVAQKMTQYPTVPCNDCRYCIPCPYGIDIPGILQHYNKCVNEGLLASDKEDPQYRRLRRKYLASYARAILPQRQADKCIGCGQCKEKCPQSIDIPKELRKLDRYVENLRKEAL